VRHQYESLLDIKRQPVNEVVGALLNKDDEAASKAAGFKLLKAASDHGIGLRDYLTLAVEAQDGLTGYETALAELNLPVQDDFKNGITLQAASETFQTYTGTRAMFPEVIDDMLRWASRQEQMENVEGLLANSRTINGVELLSTVVADDSDERNTNTIAEGARIPVSSIRTSDKSVKFFKHGSGIRTTYEFNRRASLDILTPYINRIARELQISKTKAAYTVLVNGDGLNGAASAVNQSSFDSNTNVTATAGKISVDHFLYWLVKRAQAGVPVDTVVGNYDAAFRWAQMFKVEGSDTTSAAKNFEEMSNRIAGGTVKILFPKFELVSTAANNKLLGFTKGETLEELIEAGSNIDENKQEILNQTITYIKTENTGYRLAYGDTRESFDFNA
jgi:hypothetical protein